MEKRGYNYSKYISNWLRKRSDYKIAPWFKKTILVFRKK